MSQPIFVKVDTQEATQIFERMKTRKLDRAQCETVLSLTGLPKDSPHYVPPQPARRGIFQAVMYLTSLFHSRTPKSPSPAPTPSTSKVPVATLRRESISGDDHPLARSSTPLSISETSSIEERVSKEQVFTSGRSRSQSTLVENTASSTNDAAVSQPAKACEWSARTLNAPSGFVTPAMVEFETELQPILTPLQRAIAQARAHGYHLHPRQPLRSFTAPTPTSGQPAPGLSHMKQRYVLRAHSISAGDFFRKEASHRAAVAARNLNLSKFRAIPHEERHWYEPSGVIMPEYEITRLRVVLAPRRFAINHWKTENRGPEDWIEVEERNGRGGAAIFKRDSHLRKELELFKPKDDVFDKILVGNTVPLDERGTMSPGYQVLVEPDEDDAEDSDDDEEEEEEEEEEGENVEEMTIGDEGHDDAGSDEAHSDETAHDSLPEETILPFVASRPLPELPQEATPEEQTEEAPANAAPAMEKLRRWSKNLKRRAQALTQPQPKRSVVASKMRAPRPRSRSLSGKNEADAAAAAVKARNGSSRFGSMRRIKAAASKSIGIGAGKKEAVEPVVEKPAAKETPKLRIDTGVDRPVMPKCLDAEVAENHRKLLMNKYFNPRPDAITATSAAAVPPKLVLPAASSQETLLEEPTSESTDKVTSNSKVEEEQPVSKSPVATCRPPSIIFYSSPPASPTSPTSPRSPVSPLTTPNGKPLLPRLQTQMLVPTVGSTTTATTGDRPKSPIGITLSDKMTEEEVYAHLPVSPKQAIEVFKEHARSLGL